MMSINAGCAECGEEGSVSLKTCKSCLQAKYCNAECQHKSSLLCRLRRGGGRRCQSQDLQIVYARQILQRRLSKESLAEAQNGM